MTNNDDDLNNIYELQNKELPHWAVAIHYSDGENYIKPMADDRNDKEFHEDTVLELFLHGYTDKMLGGGAATYEIIGRDNQNGQRHDYKVKLEQLEQPLDIEIARFGDSYESHKANRLRDTAGRLLKRHKHSFFMFLPTTTRESDLENLLLEAIKLPKEDIPAIDEESLIKYVEPLKRNNTPFVRRTINVGQQIHTYAIQRQGLRLALQEVIAKKEKKNYLPVQQQNMILVLDDKSLNIKREYIDQCLPLINYYFRNSTFKEIYIISRKSSMKKGRRKIGAEFMLTPVKSSINRIVINNIKFIEDKIKAGSHLPFDF